MPSISPDLRQMLIANDRGCAGVTMPAPAGRLWVFYTLLVVLLAATTSSPSLARGVYQQPVEFVNEVFAGNPPSASQLWLTGERQQVIRSILQHNYPRTRLHFWQAQGRSVWILEEIGKEEPITLGVVIQSGAIGEVRVLAYRESRGGEVRQDFFTRQFRGVTLTPDRHLSQPIDGITGATLSVRALKKMSRLALWLDREAREQHSAETIGRHQSAGPRGQVAKNASGTPAVTE